METQRPMVSSLAIPIDDVPVMLDFDFQLFPFGNLVSGPWSCSFKVLASCLLPPNT